MSDTWIYVVVAGVAVCIHVLLVMSAYHKGKPDGLTKATEMLEYMFGEEK